LANLDDPVFLVSLELRVTEEYLELMVQKDFQGPVECPAPPVLLDLMASQVKKVTKDPPESVVFLVNLALMDL
jgi:hypothetical protein